MASNSNSKTSPNSRGAVTNGNCKRDYNIDLNCHDKIWIKFRVNYIAGVLYWSTSMNYPELNISNTRQTKCFLFIKDMSTNHIVMMYVYLIVFKSTSNEDFRPFLQLKYFISKRAHWGTKSDNCVIITSNQNATPRCYFNDVIIHWVIHSSRCMLFQTPLTPRKNFV